MEQHGHLDLSHLDTLATNLNSPKSHTEDFHDLLTCLTTFNDGTHDSKAIVVKEEPIKRQKLTRARHYKQS